MSNIMKIMDERETQKKTQKKTRGAEAKWKGER